MAKLKMQKQTTTEHDWVGKIATQIELEGACSIFSC